MIGCRQDYLKVINHQSSILDNLPHCSVTCVTDIQLHFIHAVGLVVAVRGESSALISASCDAEHVVQGAGLARLAWLNDIMISSHFFTVRLRIDWFIKVVIERLEVVVGVRVETNLGLLLTKLAGAGRHQPQLLRLRGAEEAVEGPVVVHLHPLPGVLEGEVKEVHL